MSHALETTTNRTVCPTGNSSVRLPRKWYAKPSRERNVTGVKSIRSEGITPNAPESSQERPGVAITRRSVTMSSIWYVIPGADGYGFWSRNSRIEMGVGACGVEGGFVRAQVENAATATRITTTVARAIRLLGIVVRDRRGSGFMRSTCGFMHLGYEDIAQRVGRGELNETVRAVERDLQALSGSEGMVQVSVEEGAPATTWPRPHEVPCVIKAYVRGRRHHSDAGHMERDVSILPIRREGVHVRCRRDVHVQGPVGHGRVRLEGSVLAPHDGEVVTTEEMNGVVVLESIHRSARHVPCLGDDRETDNAPDREVAGAVAQEVVREGGEAFERGGCEVHPCGGYHRHREIPRRRETGGGNEFPLRDRGLNLVRGPRVPGRAKVQELPHRERRGGRRRRGRPRESPRREPYDRHEDHDDR